MFNHTIVRKPAKTIVQGITTADIGVPDYDNACLLHEKYIDALKKCNVDVTILEANEDFPDSCFVEDVALCTKECAIITRPQAQTRQNEIKLEDMTLALSKFYDNIEAIVEPGFVEAGDIMMVKDTFYIGVSDRTNMDGAKQVINILNKYDLKGEIVVFKDILHLKTGMSYLENNNLLVTKDFLDKTEFASFNKILVDDDEAYASNSIWINDKVLMPMGYTKTIAKVRALGYEVIEVDTLEFRKIDGGLSCLSLRF